MCLSQAISHLISCLNFLLSYNYLVRFPFLSRAVSNTTFFVLSHSTPVDTVPLFFEKIITCNLWFLTICTKFYITLESSINLFYSLLVYKIPKNRQGVEFFFFLQPNI